MTLRENLGVVQEEIVPLKAKEIILREAEGKSIQTLHLFSITTFLSRLSALWKEGTFRIFFSFLLTEVHVFLFFCLRFGQPLSLFHSLICS